MFRSRQMQYMYVQQSAHRCVVAVFEGPVQVCITHPPPLHPLLSLPLTFCTIPLWAHISSKHLDIYDGLSRPNTCPSQPPIQAAASPLPPPFTRYKNTLTVVLTVLLYSRFKKKRPIIPPNWERMLWPVCYFSPACYPVWFFHLIGFHLAFKQNL